MDALCFRRLIILYSRCLVYPRCRFLCSLLPMSSCVKTTRRSCMDIFLVLPYFPYIADIRPIRGVALSTPTASNFRCLGTCVHDLSHMCHMNMKWLPIHVFERNTHSTFDCHACLLFLQSCSSSSLSTLVCPNAALRRLFFLPWHYVYHAGAHQRVTIFYCVLGHGLRLVAILGVLVHAHRCVVKWLLVPLSASCSSVCIFTLSFVSCADPTSVRNARVLLRCCRLT